MNKFIPYTWAARKRWLAALKRFDERDNNKTISAASQYKKNRDFELFKEGELDKFELKSEKMALKKRNQEKLFSEPIINEKTVKKK